MDREKGKTDDWVKGSEGPSHRVESDFVWCVLPISLLSSLFAFGGDCDSWDLWITLSSLKWNEGCIGRWHLQVMPYINAPLSSTILHYNWLNQGSLYDIGSIKILLQIWGLVSTFVFFAYLVDLIVFIQEKNKPCLISLKSEIVLWC